MLQYYTWHGCRLSYLVEHATTGAILDVCAGEIVDREEWEHHHAHQRPVDVVEESMLDIISELAEVERQRKVAPSRRPRQSER